jgi:hypothetical protein
MDISRLDTHLTIVRYPHVAAKPATLLFEFNEPRRQAFGHCLQQEGLGVSWGLASIPHGDKPQRHIEIPGNFVHGKMPATTSRPESAL